MKVVFIKNPVFYGFAYAIGDEPDLPETTAKKAIELGCAKAIELQKPEKKVGEKKVETRK